MSFLLHCPACGERSVYEFQFGGKVRARPAIEAPREAWVGYVYWRDNSPGMQKEWYAPQFHIHDTPRRYPSVLTPVNSTQPQGVERP